MRNFQLRRNCGKVWKCVARVRKESGKQLCFRVVSLPLSASGLELVPLLSVIVVTVDGGGILQHGHQLIHGVSGRRRTSAAHYKGSGTVRRDPVQIQRTVTLLQQPAAVLLHHHSTPFGASILKPNLFHMTNSYLYTYIHIFGPELTISAQWPHTYL